MKQVVATLTFTHAVDPADLERHLAVEAIGGSELFPGGKDAPRFTLSYGLHHRLAYLRTVSLALPEREDFLRIALGKGVRTTQGGAATAEGAEAKTRVPDAGSFFRIDSVKGAIVRNNDGEPEQVLFVQTTSAAKPEEIAKALRVYLLPKKPASEGEEKVKWESPQEIDEAVLKDATLLPTRLVPSDKEHADHHAFRITLETDGQLFVAIGKGVHALGGFILRADYAEVLPVPELPREIAIQGAGGVLALGGERKLAIRSRGVETIEYEIARVPADQINHLVSQTSGEFQNPEFDSSGFGLENIARIAMEQQSIAVKNKWKANFSAFDVSRHLHPATDGGSALQGLFFLKAREWHPPKPKKAVKEEDGGAVDEDEEDEEEDDSHRGNRAEDTRFILVTDLGMIVKENADGARDVFLASIKTGDPLAGVAVEVLAKNGVPLLRGETGADGRVAFPSQGKLTREKRPIAFVSRRGDDVAFMPYEREDRKLDLSRFDIGGVESRSGAELDAFVFTERGIYRPGDEIHIGLLVKQRDWRGKLDGLPIETEIIDARGTAVQTRKLALPPMGFAETTYQTAPDSPTGGFTINAYLVREGKRGTLLGSAEAQVKEFLPDRMKIESRLSKAAKGGWIAPDAVSATVTLRNLYGTPASGRRVASRVVLSPAEFEFPAFSDYTFFDRLRAEDKEVKRQTVELGEATTDAEGSAKIDLQLERFADATYAATFYTEGFEAGSGRSVAAQNGLLISAQPFVIGYKEEGKFDYIPMGEARALHWIALNPALENIAVENLECRLIEHTYLSVLTKQDNGDYAYESVLREKPIRTEKLSIAAEGLRFPLPTDVPGKYVLELRDEHGARVSSVEFNVVGRGAVSRSLEKNAELEVKLSRSDFRTGEEIEISVVAPYTGSGLITIERDKVYAHAWFKADATSSVQRIRVPEGFEGTGYVNVCFVRALDSKEVFMSPLSYAAAPFRANVETRRLAIGLRTPEKAKPGEPFRIGYKTDRPSRIAVFAVDQGILQVTGYKLPDPLEHFFRKSALMVETSQIVDLILPEFSILRSAAAFGGDGDRHLNPFKRVTEKPVVYWSGVLDADQREREVVYEVPDYFSGTLTVMAVALSPDAVGSAEKNALVRGPFVITPSVPTVAAPGDVFDVGVTVANDVPGSGENAEVRLAVEASEHLEIVQPAPLLRVPEGREISATLTVRAKEKLGSASLTFRASTAAAAGQETRVRSTLSVRPPVPFMTSVRGGNFTKEAVEVPIERALHADFRKLDATVSALPLGLARGLDAFLKNYPNGCSEQITSGAFCRLLLSDEVDFGLTRAEVHSQLERTFATLRRRQNDQGSFGYWAADGNDGIDFVSAYVMHFLVEAKAAGFPPPQNVLQSGLRHLQAIDPHNLREARTQAYAIYLLTREGVITTNYILNLRDYLEKQHAKAWPGDLTAIYLAGACALLKKRDEAQRLIKGYRLGTHDLSECWDFHSTLGTDSQYVAILARHFPELLAKVSAAEFQAIVKPVSEGRFNTLSAAYAVLALKSYSQHLAKNAPQLAITQIANDKRATPVRTDGSALLLRVAFSADATALRFSAKNQPRGIGAFFQVVEAGYDLAPPAKSIADGLEAFRVFEDGNGHPIDHATLGEPLTVRLRMRSLRKQEITNVALVDLLPGAFEIAAGSLQPGVGSAGCDYVDVREDRTIFFTRVGLDMREITYQIKPTNRGTFTVPPVFAESMYEPGVKACGVAGKITVLDAK